MKPVRNLMLFPVVVLLLSCTKESFSENPADLLKTTTDSLHFDTVFTSAGSVTQYFRILNENDKGIRISSIRLAGGDASPFRINADGIPGPLINDISIAARDSLYVFVTVSINPDASLLPFIVRDSIEISYNGNSSFVQLDAYGRNAVFLRNEKITGTETWNSNLPYVILGSLTVDTNAVLQIPEGSRIYMHADAPFIIHGSLRVQGNSFDSTRVIFSGDRLDEPYRNFPASYPGLIFTPSSNNNILNYTIIKNAYQGIVISGSDLQLHEVIIDNAYDAGILAIGASIEARNLLVSNCGKNIMLVNGGQYLFEHCTAAAYSTGFFQHRDPVLLVSNFLDNNISPLHAVFRNCIFWGEENGLVQNEVEVLKSGNTAFHVEFDHVLWRLQQTPAHVQGQGLILNENPMFQEIDVAERIFNFRLKDGSPALNSGTASSVNSDLDALPRPVGQPDLGAYEKQ